MSIEVLLIVTINTFAFVYLILNNVFHVSPDPFCIFILDYPTDILENYSDIFGEYLPRNTLREMLEFTTTMMFFSINALFTVC